MHSLSGAVLSRCSMLRIPLFLFCLLGSSQSLHAQESLNLSWSLQQTLLHNPELQQFPYQLRAAEARALQAAAQPAINAEVTLENVFGSGNHRNTDNAELTLSLSQLIELGDKRAQRVEVARASARILQDEYELARLEVLAETTRRYYALLRQQALQRWIDERIILEQDAMDAIQARADAGAVGQADVSRIALRLERSRARQQELLGDLALARAELAAMWSAQPETRNVEGDLATLPVLPDAEELTVVIEQAPILLTIRNNQKLASARVRLEEAARRADITAGLGIRRFQADNDEALVLSFSMPLQRRDRNQGNIAAARAEEEWSLAQLDILRNDLSLLLRRIHLALGNHIAHALRLQETLLPLAQQLLADTEIGYRQGQYDVLQFLDAQSELVELQRELIDTRTAVHVQLLELEQITGQSLTRAAVTSTAPQENPQ